MRGGFTLLEVLISIALLLALLGAMFGFMFNMLDHRRRALDRSAQHRAVATLVERIESDLFACLVGDATSGAGVSGSNDTLTVLTRSVSASLAPNGVGDARVFSDLQRSEYRFVSGRGVVELRREPHVTGSTGSGEFGTLGGELAQIRFRFHDGTEWTDSFDSLAAGHLPRAIEVAAWFDTWGTEEPDPDRIRVIIVPDGGAGDDNDDEGPEFERAS